MARVLIAVLLAALPLGARAASDEEEKPASTEVRHEVTAGEISVSSAAHETGGAGLQNGAQDGADGKDSPPSDDPLSFSPAASAALTSAMQAAFGDEGEGCQPPQPPAPGKIDWHWDGRACIDGAALQELARTSEGWSNDAWRGYFFSVIERRGIPNVAMPVSLAAIEPELVARGAGLQRNSAGEIRGRIFLPTGNLNDRWSRSIDVVQNKGWCDPWGWVVR